MVAATQGHTVLGGLASIKGVRVLGPTDTRFVDTTRGYDPQSSNPVPRLISFTAAEICHHLDGYAANAGLTMALRFMADGRLTCIDRRRQRPCI